jgi:hypothetical protein
MLIMAEVTSEMGAELRASAMAAGTSVAAEVGRPLERLDRLEATVEAGSKVDGLGSVHPVHYRFAGQPAEVGTVVRPSVEERAAAKARCLAVAEALIRQGREEDSLYSGPPNPLDMFRNTGGGR